MWRRLGNFLYSLQTYQELGPDLHIRQQVNQWLSQRSALNPTEWHSRFWQTHGVSRAVATFVYNHLTDHSGLEIARTWPTDHLEQDLHLTLVCWFDWHLELCDHFCQQFAADQDACLAIQQIQTMQELVLFLEAQATAPVSPHR